MGSLRCIASTHADAAKGSSAPIAISRESDLDGGRLALGISSLAILAHPCHLGLGANQAGAAFSRASACRRSISAAARARKMR